MEEKKENPNVSVCFFFRRLRNGGSYRGSIQDWLLLLKYEVWLRASTHIVREDIQIQMLSTTRCSINIWRWPVFHTDLHSHWISKRNQSDQNQTWENKKYVLVTTLCRKGKKGHCYVVPHGGKSFRDCSGISMAARSSVNWPKVI